MSKSQMINKVQNRTERTEYTGKFNDFQSFGSSYKGKRYNDYEKDPYNKYQNLLYKRSLFGLTVYTQEEIKAMHPEKVERIQKVNKKAQRELNIFKQEVIIKMTNAIFGVFKKSNTASAVIDLYSKPDPKFISKTSFKDLGVDKQQIIDRLVQKRILPSNFNTLQQ